MNKYDGAAIISIRQDHNIARIPTNRGGLQSSLFPIIKPTERLDGKSEVRTSVSVVSSSVITSDNDTTNEIDTRQNGTVLIHLDEFSINEPNFNFTLDFDQLKNDSSVNMTSIIQGHTSGGTIEHLTDSNTTSEMETNGKVTVVSSSVNNSSKYPVNKDGTIELLLSDINIAGTNFNFTIAIDVTSATDSPSKKVTQPIIVSEANKSEFLSQTNNEISESLNEMELSNTKKEKAEEASPVEMDTRDFQSDIVTSIKSTVIVREKGDKIQNIEVNKATSAYNEMSFIDRLSEMINEYTGIPLYKTTSHKPVDNSLYELATIKESESSQADKKKVLENNVSLEKISKNETNENLADKNKSNDTSDPNAKATEEIDEAEDSGVGSYFNYISDSLISSWSGLMYGEENEIEEPAKLKELREDLDDALSKISNHA